MPDSSGAFRLLLSFGFLEGLFREVFAGFVDPDLDADADVDVDVIAVIGAGAVIVLDVVAIASGK
jgi:S-adenosylmethionine:diacylglycerol 3-amino-3-carboxypropyl transferase